MTNLDSVLKTRDITLPTKFCWVKAIVFPVVMYGCESWTIKKAECLRMDAFELWCWRRLLRVPWIKPVNPKGYQPWIFIARTDAEAPILWQPDTKSQFIRKDSDAGKDWKQKKRAADDKMVRQYHQLNEHEFELTPGDGGGQRSLTCHSPCVCKEPERT